MIENNKIGTNIKKFRKKEKLTQKELANKLNIRYQTVQKYEKGIISNIPLETIIKLSKILGVSIQDILGIKEN